MTSKTPTQTRRLANERLCCDAPGCMLNRNYIGRFCLKHTVAFRRHGHAAGHSVSRATLASYRTLFETFLDEHHNHPAVAAAIDWMERLLKLGTSRASSVHSELDRLWHGGLRGREALTAVGAVVLWSFYYPSDIPDDDRLTFSMARHLTLCRSQDRQFSGIRSGGKAKHWYRQPTTKTLRELGSLLRSTLGGFFRQVIEQLEEKDRATLALADALRTPFTTNATAPALAEPVRSHEQDQTNV